LLAKISASATNPDNNDKMLKTVYVKMNTASARMSDSNMPL